MGFLSAADGFFVLAGLLLGKIYLPRFIKNPGAARFSLIKRCGQLFLANIIIALAVPTVELIGGSDNVLWPQNAFALIFGRYTVIPPYFDAILSIYALGFFIIAVFGPWFVRYPKGALLASFGIWGLGLMTSPQGSSAPYFCLLSWLLYLLGGAVIGFLQSNNSQPSRSVLWACFIGLGAIFGLRHLEEIAHLARINTGAVQLHAVEFWGNKRTIGPLRILDVAFAGLAIQGSRRWLEPVLIALGFHRIGKVGLQIFVFQGVLTPVLAAYFAKLAYPLEYGLLVAVWATLLVFALTTNAIKSWKLRD